MIVSEALPATDRIRAIGGRGKLTGRRVVDTTKSLLFRLLVAVFLVAVAVLIPGEASRVLEAPPVTWSDIFRV